MNTYAKPPKGGCMNLVFEVDNVTTVEGIRLTMARLPFKLSLVVIEGQNKHDLTLCFNKRLSLKMIEAIQQDVQTWE